MTATHTATFEPYLRVSDAEGEWVARLALRPTLPGRESAALERGRADDLAPAGLAERARAQLEKGQLANGFPILEDITCGIEFRPADAGAGTGVACEYEPGTSAFRVTFVNWDDEGVEAVRAVLDGDLAADTYDEGDHALVGGFEFGGRPGCEAHLYFMQL